METELMREEVENEKTIETLKERYEKEFQLQEQAIAELKTELQEKRDRLKAVHSALHAEREEVGKLLIENGDLRARLQEHSRAIPSTSGFEQRIDSQLEDLKASYEEQLAGMKQVTETTIAQYEQQTGMYREEILFYKEQSDKYFKIVQQLTDGIHNHKAHSDQMTIQNIALQSQLQQAREMYDKLLEVVRNHLPSE
jgi:chromosome segregation ATPase